MGLHGGINILHQKKWHVYNADNRAIVQRDEENHARRERAKQQVKHSIAIGAKLHKLGSERVSGEYRREAKDTEKALAVVHRPLNDEDRYERLLKEKLRGDDPETAKFADKERFKNERGGASGRWLDKGAKKQYEKEYDREAGAQALDLDGSDKHINLFQDVEFSRQKRTKEHAQYLRDVGHDAARDVSSFSQFAEEQKVERTWYMKDSEQRRMEVATFQRRGNRPLSDHREYYNKTRRGGGGGRSKEAEIEDKKVAIRIGNLLQHSLKREKVEDLAVSSNLTISSLPTSGEFIVAATDDGEVSFRAERLAKLEKHKQDLLKFEQEKVQRQLDEKETEMEDEEQFARQKRCAGDRWSERGRGGHHGFDRKRGMRSFGNDEPNRLNQRRAAAHEEPARDPPPSEGKKKEGGGHERRWQEPPKAPAGHDGWSEDDTVHGPRSLAEETWPRLLPRDFDYNKDRRRRQVHKRRYLNSDSD
eukprot:GHVH01012063.1.p1 GENE.GHVH01012063.1~~GHVH01012063.1.p1  ORF type:complete len:476 (+),score=90.88 GHVH01012063.1:16-1443(+)